MSCSGLSEPAARLLSLGKLLEEGRQCVLLLSARRISEIIWAIMASQEC